MTEEQRNPSGDVQYVLGGRALLHGVPGLRGSTYEIVSHLYVRYVTQKYSVCSIVFDGYNDDPTTKDDTQLRRTGDCVGVTVGPCVYGYFWNRVPDSRNGRVSGYPKIER